MRWSDVRIRLRALRSRDRAEAELDEELRFHLEMEARKQRAAGDARPDDSALVNFGGLEQVREQCRDVRGLTLLENMARDFRYGVRVLRQSPVFTAVAVLSLAIGIGANTAVFSLYDTVLLRVLPVREPKELTIVRWGAQRELSFNATWASGGGDGRGRWTKNVFSWAIFQEMRRGSKLREVFGFSPLGPVNLAVNGRALAGGAMVASGNFYQALGVTTILGRPFSSDDETIDGLPAAVISYRFWDRAFARDAGAIGRTVYVNGKPCAVAGVTSRDFVGISQGGFMRTPEVDVTLPIRTRELWEGAGAAKVAWFGDLFWIQVMGRLPDRTQEQAAISELAAIVVAGLPEEPRRELGREIPDIFLDEGAQGLDSLRSSYRKPLLILMAVVGLTLLMTCVNLAGLLLARASAREKEISLRLALGAGRMRIIRQLLMEGAMLSILGGAAGLLLAYWAVQGLLALLSSGTAPIPVQVSLDFRVLAFAGAVSMLATGLFALVPALRATRIDLLSSLKGDAARSRVRFEGRRADGNRVLLAIQVAVAVVLVGSATLLTRTLVNLRGLPLGFNPQQMVLFDVAPGKNGYDEARGNQLYARLTERLKEIPGVTGVSMSGQRLISGWVSNGGIYPDGASGVRVRSHFNFVGADFLEVMGIPLLYGRPITTRDLGSSVRVAVVNESLARKLSSSGAVLGRRFRWRDRDDRDVEVVGVVKDAKYDRLRGEMPATAYVPYTQRPFGWPQEMSYAVRIANQSPVSGAAIARAVASVDPMLPVMQLKTQEAQIDDTLSQERLLASVIGLFSGITLVVACIGLYGSVAYSVTRRVHEIGIRLALGARPAAVLGMLMRQVMAVIAVGLGLGLACAWGATRVIGHMLFGVQPHDPMSLGGACVAVLVITAIAALLPARRVFRIEPLRALRCE
ncbi:MAG: ABC transporter permease [Bryobacterales bacterium]|nr:ABC transporter permease [Bryobacterales bacterium]